MDAIQQLPWQSADNSRALNGRNPSNKHVERVVEKRLGKQKVVEFWEKVIACFPLMQYGPQGKRRLQQYFVAAGTILKSCYLATIGRYTDRPTYSSLVTHEPHIKRRIQQFFYCCMYSLSREPVYRAVA
jgi:hypothetical protein